MFSVSRKLRNKMPNGSNKYYCTLLNNKPHFEHTVFLIHERGSVLFQEKYVIMRMSTFDIERYVNYFHRDIIANLLVIYAALIWRVFTCIVLWILRFLIFKDLQRCCVCVFSGMFTYVKESQCHWFSNWKCDNCSEYRLVGAVSFHLLHR